jgi:uncharacterized hydrophobic protein (TIGR00271 family)
MAEMQKIEAAPGEGSDRHPLADWWRRFVIGTVDHRAVLEAVEAEANWSGHYAFMTVMSAGIAVLGLLLSSPAVVIGAMLISPLMGPIIGFGFGLALFSARRIRRTLLTIGAGVLLAVLFCALIVALSPLQSVTEEIAARTRPNLFDLMVATFSGLAGTYAMVRGRQGAIVGVAIAVAVMPPLAVMGFGLATFNWTVFWGSTFLFFTNLMAIGVMAAVLARLYGFGHRLSPSQSGLQAAVIIGTMIALSIPLGLALRQIAWEAVASRHTHDVIAARFGDRARIDQVAIDYDASPIRISATVLTPTFQTGAEGVAERLLTAVLKRPVEVTIEQLRISTAEAETYQVAAARAGDRAERRADRVAERLALVAGVSPDAILIDRSGARAVVRAAPLPGATLATYRQLEARVASAESGWQVNLIPPVATLAPVTFGEEDEPDEAGREAVATAIWGARRLQLPLGVEGASSEQVEAVLRALEAAAVAAERSGEPAGEPGTVRLQWRLPVPDPP